MKTLFTLATILATQVPAELSTADQIGLIIMAIFLLPLVLVLMIPVVWFLLKFAVRMIIMFFSIYTNIR